MTVRGYVLIEAEVRTASVVVALMLAFAAASLPWGRSAQAASPTPAAATVIPAVPAAPQTPSARLTPTEEPPSTPGPPSPTPALPEEGGPPGGILGGYLYSDDDGDGKRSSGDSPVSTQVLVERIPSDSSDLSPRIFSAEADVKGRWEVRGLADGRYRVSWAPPVRDPADAERSIPPPTDIVINTEHTVRLPNRVIEIVKANRILNIDFGMPHQDPVSGAGARQQLPNTGAGGGGGVSANELVLFAGLAASAALALGLAAARRRRE